MADQFTIRISNVNRILDTLKKRREASAPKSPALKRALERAALLLVNQAKLRIRKERLIDTGRLFNSLRFEHFRTETGGQGVRVGSFGVPYAAVWEGLLGTEISIKAHARTITKAFGKDIPPKTVAIARHTRKISPRPFLGPAYQTHKHRIVGIIRDSLLA